MQKTTGMLAPSKKPLIDAIIHEADLPKKKCVIELGSGTGVFTKRIMKKINTETSFFVLEINDYFVKETRRRCPGIKVYHDSANNINQYLIENGYNSCDCVISGLPWSYFDYNLQKEMLLNIEKSLCRGGSFITYAHLHGLILPSAKRFKKLLNEIFLNVSMSKIIWKNFPPCIIYHAKK